MSEKVLFGLFDKNASIEKRLIKEIKKTSYRNLYIENFETFESKNELIVFSGVVLNRNELNEFAGIKTESDAELIHYLFSKENYQGFKRINGKFLIIIQTKTSTIVARDRYGQGPMFYYNNECFTNLFWQLQSFKNIYFEPEITALGNYLMYSYIPSPLTAFKNIKKLAGERY